RLWDRRGRWWGWGLLPRRAVDIAGGNADIPVSGVAGPGAYQRPTDREVVYGAVPTVGADAEDVPVAGQREDEVDRLILKVSGDRDGAHAGSCQASADHAVGLAHLQRQRPMQRETIIRPLEDGAGEAYHHRHWRHRG